MEQALCLALGSVAGGFARWLIGSAAARVVGHRFPWGTLLVNLSGCLLIGVFHGLGGSRFSLGPQARLLLMVGFCGAFTTFSTMVLEASAMAENGNAAGAGIYVAASVLLGFLLFQGGALAASTFSRVSIGTAATEAG